MQADEVSKFWFEELTAKQRWTLGEQLDPIVEERFSKVHQAAVAGELWHWRETANGRLAEIIVLDQFSRHIYRNQAAAFAADPQAVVLAQEAVRCGADQALDRERRMYVYMPLMHSESQAVHQWALELFEALGESLEWEIKHKNIIDRFGRYPHRNALLGRESTPEELEFLNEPGSSFL